MEEYEKKVSIKKDAFTSKTLGIIKYGLIKFSAKKELGRPSSFAMYCLAAD